MIKWQDQALIVQINPFQEKHRLVLFFSKTHGLHRGLLFNSNSKKNIPLIGTFCIIQFRARLEKHLGKIDILDLIFPTPITIFKKKVHLTILSCMTAIFPLVLQDNDPAPNLFELTYNLCKKLSDSKCPYVEYFLWEKALLAELGFALSLNKCGVKQTTENLCYVSPKTGRAISKEIGAPYHHKLLPLPNFLIDASSEPNLSEAYYMLGFFLQQISPKIKEVRYVLKRYLHLFKDDQLSYKQQHENWSKQS